ncbi:MAG: peptidoglycan editing factor PgeF [Actinomycetota bacterium]
MFQWRAFRARAGEPPGAYLAVPSLEDAGIHVAFTARSGGWSEPPFDGLDLSFVSGDDPEVVRRNRARALDAIAMPPGSWTSGRQVHGVGVAAVTTEERGRGALDPGDAIADMDALWTDEPSCALAVLTADCLPIVLADPVRRRLAVIHAGWRGLIGGVVANAAGAFEDAADVVACVGPSIGPCCYEVGDDVALPAVDALGADVITSRRLDLWRAARLALTGAGITSISIAALCTRCEPHRFYSHRAGDAARQGVVAAIASS